MESLLKAASFAPEPLKFLSPWTGLLPIAAWLVQETKPTTFVELGTQYGNSYFAFCEAVKQNKLATHCTAIDTWKGDEHAGSYSEEVFDYCSFYNDEHYHDFSILLRTTFDEASVHFAEKSIDLLHIDGFHTYEAVSNDFSKWLPKMQDNGIILFHDICIREGSFGVWKLWDELKVACKNYLEFSHSCGLGVLFLGDEAPSWFPKSPEEKGLIATYFEALGERQFERYELAALRKLSPPKPDQGS